MQSQLSNFYEAKNKSDITPGDLVKVFYEGKLEEEMGKKFFLEYYIEELFTFDCNDIEKDLEVLIQTKFENFQNFYQLLWIFLTDEKTNYMIKLNDDQFRQVICLLCKYLTSQLGDDIDDDMLNKIILVSDIFIHSLDKYEDFIVQQIVGCFHQKEDKKITKTHIPSRILLAMYLYDSIYLKLKKNNELMFSQYATYLQLTHGKNSKESKLCLNFMKKFKQKGLHMEWIKKYELDQIDASNKIMQDKEEHVVDFLRRLFMEFKTKKYQNQDLIDQIVIKFNDLSDRQEILKIVFQEIAHEQPQPEKTQILVKMLSQILEKYNFQSFYCDRILYQLDLINFINRQLEETTVYLNDQSNISSKFCKKVVEQTQRMKNLCLTMFARIYQEVGDICKLFFDQKFQKEIENVIQDDKKKICQVLPDFVPVESYHQDEYFIGVQNLEQADKHRELRIKNSLSYYLVKNNFQLLEDLLVCIKFKNARKEDQAYFHEMMGKILFQYFQIKNQLVQKRVQDLLSYLEIQNDEFKIDLDHFQQIQNVLREKGLLMQHDRKAEMDQQINADSMCKKFIYDILNLKASMDEQTETIYNAYKHKEVQMKIWPALFKSLSLEKINMNFLERVTLKLISMVIQNYGIYTFTSQQMRILDFIKKQTHHQEQKYRDLAIDAFFEFYKQAGEVTLLFTDNIKPHVLKRIKEIVKDYELKELKLKHYPFKIIPHIEVKDHENYMQSNKNYFDYSENDKKSMETATQLIRDALLLFVVKHNSDLLQCIKKQLVQLKDKKKIQNGTDILFNESLKYFNEENQLIKKRAVSIFHYFIEEFSHENALQIFNQENLQTLIQQFFKIMRVSSHSEIFADDLFVLQKELISKEIITFRELKTYLKQINHNNQQDFTYLDVLINHMITTSLKQNKNLLQSDDFQNKLKESIQYIKKKIHKINDINHSKEEETLKAHKFSKYRNGYIKTQFISVLAFIQTILKDKEDVQGFIQDDLCKMDKDILGNKVSLYQSKYKQVLQH